MDAVFTDLRKKLSNYSEPRKYCLPPPSLRGSLSDRGNPQLRSRPEEIASVALAPSQ